MALHDDVIWEFRPTATGASNNNGGGFKAGASGTDFSQQGAPQYALTGVTTAGADDTLLSASAAADMVGNIANIVSGTNFTAGKYEIIAVVVGVSIQLDRTCASAAGAAGVVNIGGALDTFTDGFFDNDVQAAGANRIYVKNTGTMTLGGALTVASKAGTAARAAFIQGYNTTRTDAPTGTSRPLIDMGANNCTWAGSCDRWSWRHLRWTATGTAGTETPPSSEFVNCKFSNTSGTAGRIAVFAGSSDQTATYHRFIGCEFNSTNGTAVAVARATSTPSNQSYFIGCWFHDSVTGIASSGASGGVNLNLINCIISKCSTAGVGTNAGTFVRTVLGCTFYGAETPAGVGLNLVVALPDAVIMNNIFYGWTTALSCNTLEGAETIDYNDFYNNTTDRTNANAGAHDIALDPAFVDATNNDFRVGVNVKAVGYPGVFSGSFSTAYLDMGAVQRKEDYPTNAQVESGVSFGNGSGTGTLSASGGAAGIF